MGVRCYGFMNNKLLDRVSQIAIPSFTIFGFVLISIQRPDLGLIFSMIAQPFWLFSTWKSYKEAGQIGLFVTAVIMTAVIGFGIINYWILN